MKTAVSSLLCVLSLLLFAACDIDHAETSYTGSTTEYHVYSNDVITVTLSLPITTNSVPAASSDTIYTTLPPADSTDTEESHVTTTCAETEEETPIIENIDGITYVNGILIVNKTYPLPKDYSPGFSAEAQTALDLMCRDAALDGVTLKPGSRFRDYARQEYLYNYFRKTMGQESADKDTARPGYSEHQSGLAVDFETELSFAFTPEGIWVAENCHKYGFIIRYPEGKEDITGFNYEPWHIRYLGTETALKVYESGLCLEEYLGITSFYQ